MTARNSNSIRKTWFLLAHEKFTVKDKTRKNI